MTISAILSAVANSYPSELREDQHRDIQRIAWHLQMLGRHLQTGSTVADIGGGIGLMSPGMAALGYRSILVDDFRDSVNGRFHIESLGVHKDVRVISADATSVIDVFEANSLDGITSFESMEHWHNSPKRAFHALMRALKPGGLFFLGVPNCVDLTKRIKTVTGTAQWSTMRDWYEEPIFRGHVREASVSDLHYISRDLGLRETKITGRNWEAVVRFGAIGKMADALLTALPSLCSDIYLIARKP
jgi:SAM-dependent methyltransferase